jgi:hypothetical protein
MYMRKLLIIVGLGVASLLPAFAADNRPQSTNPNVKRAVKKSKKVRPAKYKAPKKNKKPKHATFGKH